jgi:hypothetical protein
VEKSLSGDVPNADGSEGRTVAQNVALQDRSLGLVNFVFPFRIALILNKNAQVVF